MRSKIVGWLASKVDCDLAHESFAPKEDWKTRIPASVLRRFAL